jgi:hypothetical protein
LKVTSVKTHAIFIVVISITILHFLITSIVEHYIDVQIGLQIGQEVTEGLIKATEIPKSSVREADKIYQEMKDKSNNVLSKWKIPSFLISLPLKPIIYPLLEKIKKVWLYDPVFYKEISIEQFKIRGRIIRHITNALNSTAFGVLIYLINIFFHWKKHKMQRSALDKGH